ncbi:ParA family protein [Bdellovibrio svalbardensis]|uniref:AAA family ATPase n=1 Tax=Bdellovibrio svalbardensis TaxID=2972972 RepID=A0ABT6DMJ0_9BACT|nr:ParA family protein [Bdellovibrio svalbardensis]MDG0817036.1 AAA family ATPase [Bdellovibrio svalbardensis]
MGNVVSFINQKGGVAKTTTAINVAAQWAKEGKKILLIDLDPQSSATRAIFGDMEFEDTIYDVLTSEIEASQAIVSSETFGIDVIPSEIMLSGIEIILASKFGRESILKRCLAEVKDQYDIVVIDCSPSLGLLTVNALIASKDIVIPICPEYFSLKGIDLILETLKHIHVGLGHKVEVRGIIISKYRNRRIIEQVINDLKTKYTIPVFNNYIPESVVVEEAHHRHLPMLEYSPKNPAGLALANLAMEMWA